MNQLLHKQSDLPPKAPKEQPIMKSLNSTVPGSENFPEEDLLCRYEFIRILGSGSYGQVCEANCLRTGDAVAIKKIFGIFNNTTDTKRLLRELMIPRMLGPHPHILGVRDIIPPRNFKTFSTLYVVFDFMQTDLSNLIASDQFFTELHIQYMLYQLLVAIKYFHSAMLIHRDLKPANILVNEDCAIKICDFGLGAKFVYDNERKTTICCTTNYTAQEILNHRK
eukprot:422567_1